MTRIRLMITTLLLALMSGLWVTTANATSQDVPVIHTVLPKDAISASIKPAFVAAAVAQVEDAAMMIGVVFNEDAPAYSAVLLNAHEIVNDTLGGRQPENFGATAW